MTTAIPVREVATRPAAAPTGLTDRTARREADSEKLARNVGFWSSGAAGVILALSMIAFLVLGPWISMAVYAADPNPLKIGIWVLFLLLTLATVLAVAAVHTLTPERLRLWSLSAFGFAVAYAAICAANCVIQFTFVQQRSLNGDLTGLEAWASASPNSALFATDQLAFFFQGLATLLLAPLLGGSLILNVVKWQFVVNGVFTAIGVVATGLGSYAGPDGQFLYAASVLPWGINLAIAFGLLAVVFQRRLFQRSFEARSAART